MNTTVLLTFAAMLAWALFASMVAYAILAGAAMLLAPKSQPKSRYPQPLRTVAEVQSGLDRLHWAEALILQLPANHDGRNRWLMNYGRAEEARQLRAKRGLTFNELSQAVDPPGKAQ